MTGRSIALLIASPLPLAVILACSDARPACYPNEYVACTCASGRIREGYATCVGEGTGYGPCVCDGTTPGVDASRVGDAEEEP